MKDKPKIIKSYHLNGNIHYIYYYLNGLSHREDGPAAVWYYDDGNLYSSVYFINGKELTESEWLIYCRKRKLKTIL